MKNFFLIAINFFLIFFFGIAALAQTGVGKLGGKVTDAESKEGLIGANIVILNTDMGAASDVNGDYFILNVTPGTYDVKVSYVGYGDQILRNIKIVPGVTQELNVTLIPGIELREIVVTDRPFETKATNTVKVFSDKEINNLPVKGVENLVSLQSGVVIAEGSGGASGNATINVRGGRGGEVVYIVDGVIQNDPYYGQNFSYVSNAAIEQIAFQVGGFEAKYGQAQSGIVNVTTKSGSPFYTAFADVLTSSFTDDYGYNLYTVTLGGPIIPNVKGQTFFLSTERGWFLDSDPSAVGVEFKSIDYKSATIPGNNADVWRVSGRTYHELTSDINLRFGVNYNARNYRSVLLFGDLVGTESLKNNSEHNPRIQDRNLSLTGRYSHNLNKNSFINLNLGYKKFSRERGDGIFFDRLQEYGDTLYNPYLTTQGDHLDLNIDEAGIFQAKGYVYNNYLKVNNNTFVGDLSYTNQLDNHLIEFGVGGNYNILRLYSIGPLRLALNNRTYIDANGDTVAAKSLEERFEERRPLRYGYDVMGNEIGTDAPLGAPTPILAFAYLQDRFELEDLVLNLGLRVDYFNSKTRVFKNPSLPYGGGTNPQNFDDGDYIERKPEWFVSPRIGLGFPVTDNTIFHAQFGRFIQEPRLADVVLFESRTYLLRQTDNFGFNNGEISSEITTQYEIGFRQAFGNDVAALNVTAFYKNTEGLTNQSLSYFFREEGGQRFKIFGSVNSDFGTVKGLAINLDVPRLSYFSFSLNYTFSIAEGTGSSTNSSYVAAFRNIGGEIPKVVAPLDFDQRHTGVFNINFFVPENDLGFLERTSANLLVSFNSGRPYTPLETQNLLVDFTNYGDTKGYVNSKYGPGSFRIDLKLEKSFKFESFEFTPYLWVENLLDAKNVGTGIDPNSPGGVWRSTGSPSTTNFLETEQGKTQAAAKGEDWVNDYKSLENNPYNYGIPRLIKLGFKVNFSSK